MPERVQFGVIACCAGSKPVTLACAKSHRPGLMPIQNGDCRSVCSFYSLLVSRVASTASLMGLALLPSLLLFVIVIRLIDSPRRNWGRGNMFRWVHIREKEKYEGECRLGETSAQPRIQSAAALQRTFASPNHFFALFYQPAIGSVRRHRSDGSTLSYPSSAGERECV